MSELLFECYGVPSVAYGIDALFSAHHNIGIESGITDALIVSSGHQTTHILPVLGGQVDPTHCKRCGILHVPSHMCNVFHTCTHMQSELGGTADSWLFAAFAPAQVSSSPTPHHSVLCPAVTGTSQLCGPRL